MKFIKNSLFFTILIFTVVFATFFCCSAGSDKIAPYENMQKISSDILSVSYRGDTSAFPENSFEAILSAQNKGADMVSVSVMKTADGVFVLCENESLNNICDAPFADVSEAKYSELASYTLYDNSGKLTECHFATLEEAIDKTDEGLFIILDFDWNLRDELYELILNKNALNRVIFRTKQGAGKICDWVSSKDEKAFVIGVYDGGIIFNAISHINSLSEIGMPLVQYQSKNYFNVMYGSLVYDNFGTDGKAAAIAPCYDPDLCGQRTDSQAGWDALINCGFTVIETGNIGSLVTYIKNRESATKYLEELKKRADGVKKEKYASVSLDNLNKAIVSAEEVLESGRESLDRIQNTSSVLVLAMNKLMIKTGDDTQKGALNITPGKIAAAVLVTAGILCGEIFVHKMHIINGKKR